MHNIDDVPGFTKSTPEDEFEEVELKQKNLHLFCLYQTYKLTNYLESFCGTKIKSMELDYAIDTSNAIYLVNCEKVIWEPFISDAYVLKQITFIDEKINNKTLYDLADPQNKRQQNDLLLMMQEYMKENYELEKRRMKIDLNDSIRNFTETNRAFQLLNPDAPFNFSDYATQKVSFQEFKDWLRNRVADEPKSSPFRKLLISIGQKQNELIKAEESRTPAIRSIKSHTRTGAASLSRIKPLQLQNLKLEASMPEDVFK